MRQLAVALAVLILSACNSGDRVMEPVSPTDVATPALPPPISDAGQPPSAPSPTVTVSFREPTPGQEIAPGQNVTVSGTVSGLDGTGLTIWIVTKPDTGDGKYYLTKAGPTADIDGDWTFTDLEVGDSSDSGKKITYTALSATRECSKELLASPPDPEAGDLRTFALMPTGCTPLAPAVAVAVR